jgi:hypothetical protein
VALAVVMLGVRHVLERPERVEGHAFAVPERRDRIVVEVLNGTEVSGLARVGTRVLRRAGIDVVSFGTGARADSTAIVVRRGGRGAAEQVRKALGMGRIEERPDSTRHVDVTVLLGADYRPPDEVHP